MDLDLTLVRSLLVLAAENDLRRAATQLGITASALSKRLHRLESQLGVAVTTRTAHGVAITAAGQRFLPHARDLIDRSQRARAAARGDQARQVVRVGLPAGGGVRLLAAAGMREIAQTVVSAMPGTQLRYVDVPFTALRTCLPEGRIDLLWTNSPVRHPAVDTFATPFTTQRIGVVGPGHPLADATEVTVGEFTDQPIFYNPLIPEEWMGPYWLADLRDRRQARLMEFDARHTRNVFGQASTPGGALVLGSIDRVDLPPSSHALTLIGASPITFHIAKRSADRGAAVRTIIELLTSRPPATLT